MMRTLMDGDSLLETLNTKCRDIIYKIMKMSTWHYMVQQSFSASLLTWNLGSQGRSVMVPNEAGNEETGYSVTQMTQTMTRSLHQEAEDLAQQVAVALIHQEVVINHQVVMISLQVVVETSLLLLLIQRKQTRLHPPTLILIQALISRQIPAVVVISHQEAVVISHQEAVVMTHLVVVVMIPLAEVVTIHPVAVVTIHPVVVETSLLEAIQLTQRQILKLPILTLPPVEAVAAVMNLLAVIQLTQKLILRQTQIRQILILLPVEAVVTILQAEAVTILQAAAVMILQAAVVMTHLVVVVMTLLAEMTTLLVETTTLLVVMMTLPVEMMTLLEMMILLEMMKKKRKQATHTINLRSLTILISPNTITLSRPLTPRIT